ncbi:hypothetical protein C8J56DRAFT_725399, partial [Mycena floridula]
HSPNRNCECTACEEDRSERGCPNPHKCVEAARKKLDALLPKWDPRRPEHIKRGD